MLGIRHHFKGVFGATAMGDTCKPDVEAFRGVLESIGADPRSTGNTLLNGTMPSLMLTGCSGRSYGNFTCHATLDAYQVLMLTRYSSRSFDGRFFRATRSTHRYRRNSRDRLGINTAVVLQRYLRSRP